VRALRALALALAGVAAGQEAARPNVLLLIADDLGADAVGAFGCPTEGTTPNLDALAAQGTRYSAAHVVVASCRPSRNGLLTGRYPHTVGGGEFDYLSVPGVLHLPGLLRAAGYRVGVLGKVEHTTPYARFGWDLSVDKGALGDGRSSDRYVEHAGAFARAAAAEGEPFLLVVNAHDPHRPFFRPGDVRRAKDAEHPPQRPSRVFQAEEVTVPPWLPDLPEVRDDYARYLSSVRRADDTMGAVVADLDTAGLGGDTVVVFLSDHGPPLPFAKSNCWRASTRTPLIVRWPGHVPAGATDGRLVSSLDLLPTLLAAVGLEAPPDLDGADLLTRSESWRTVLFTQFHQTVARRDYPMRAVIGPRYGYVYNAWCAPGQQLRCDSMNGAAWGAMRASEDAAVAARVALYLERVQEELYDYAADPGGLRDLTGEAPEELARMRRLLLEWMRSEEDPLLTDYAAFLGG